jgi:hypothetical protein
MLQKDSVIIARKDCGTIYPFGPELTLENTHFLLTMLYFWSVMSHKPVK